jgi:hypothetical protein
MSASVGVIPHLLGESEEVAHEERADDLAHAHRQQVVVVADAARLAHL